MLKFVVLARFWEPTARKVYFLRFSCVHSSGEKSVRFWMPSACRTRRFIAWEQEMSRKDKTLRKKRELLQKSYEQFSANRELSEWKRAFSQMTPFLGKRRQWICRNAAPSYSQTKTMTIHQGVSGGQSLNNNKKVRARVISAPRFPRRREHCPAACRG